MRGHGEHPLGNRAYLRLLHVLTSIDRFAEAYQRLLAEIPSYQGPGVDAVMVARRVFEEIEQSLCQGPYLGPWTRRRGADVRVARGLDRRG